jgi:hypothetical protein
MSNKTPVELDIVRNFQYGMRANHQIEKALGIKSIYKIDFDDMSTEETATLMWGGLVHEDSQLTPDKVMELVDEHSSFPVVLGKMFEAISVSFNGDGEGKKIPAEKAEKE